MSNNNKNRGSKHPHPVSDAPQIPSRRQLIKGAGLMGAAAVGTATSSGLIAADSDRATLADAYTSPVLNEALEVLTAEEAQTLEVICECLIPSDRHGPGAREARAIHYIDRSLASHNSAYRHDYMVSLSAINDYARQTRGKAYYELIGDVQNSILLALQEDKIPGCSPSSSGFFNLLRSHTIDGTFSDPYYGGNQNFVGWDMLRYPGIRLSASETDVAQGAELPANHQSAYDHATYRKMIRNLQGGNDNA
jgi:gluconate 2-dehydrogenase gamma chain